MAKIIEQLDNGRKVEPSFQKAENGYIAVIDGKRYVFTSEAQLLSAVTSQFTRS